MNLTQREKQVIYLRYTKNYTLKEIADELGITIARAQQINAQATKKHLQELDYEQCINLIDSKVAYGRPRVHEWELIAIKKCLMKYYDLSLKK